MEEKKNIFYQNKHKFLNSSDLLDNFKKSYLNSLQVILDDEKFKEKTDTLPLLKSSVINKYEKMFAKRELEKQKILNRENNLNSTEPNNIRLTNRGRTTNSLLKKSVAKPIPIRYIIIDNHLINITLEGIEENNEINNQLTDPLNSYFQESNPKVRKKAVEAIINNIFIKPTQNNKNINNKNVDKTKSNILPKINRSVEHIFKNDENLININKNKNYDDIFYKDLEELDLKYKLNTEHNNENHEKYKEVIKRFNDKCEDNNITTLGQKIDYFVYLFNKDSSINPKIMEMKNNIVYGNNPNSNFKRTKKNFRRLSIISTKSSKKLNSRRNSNYFSDIKLVYYYEIKSAFKLSDDMIHYNINSFEKYEKELVTKIKSFQLVQKNLVLSQKIIDKLRLHLLNLEINSENIILRDCHITSEKFVYLLYKKYFDFSKLKKLNLSNNNLGDIGGTYVIFLVSKYGQSIEYLNIGYNFIGKNCCQSLIDSLSNNNLKVTSLCLSGNKLGDKMFSEISEGISKNIYLNKLFIGNNNLGKISSVVIGSILKYDKKIKLIDVSKNNFGDDIIGYMLKGLIVNSTLETLILNDLGLTNKSFRTFAITLVINTTLKTLFLERNKLNYKACKMLSDILNNNRYIEYISLVGNNFEHEHINYIIEQQRQVKLKVISKSDYFIQINSIGENVNLYEYLD